MKSICKIALASLLLISVSAMSANVTVGDKQWRQVTDTLNTSWDSFAASCDLSTGLCGAAYSGWTWASSNEVRDMWVTLTGTQALAGQTFFQQSNSTWAPLILSNFGPTFVNATSSRIYGLVREKSSQGAAFGRINEISEHDGSTLDIAWADGYITTSISSPIVGAWMYVTIAVPEPGSYLLLAIGLGFLAAFRHLVSWQKEVDLA